MKNEGLLLIGALGAGVLVAMARTASRRTTLASILPLAVGALPFLLLLFWFRVRFGGQNNLLELQEESVWILLANPARWAGVVRGLAATVFNFDRSVIMMLPVLGAVVWSVGVERAALRTDISLIVGTATVCMLAAYVFVYVTTPHEINFHIRSSVYRLLLQLWPMLLYAFFLVLRPQGSCRSLTP